MSALIKRLQCNVAKKNTVSSGGIDRRDVILDLGTGKLVVIMLDAVEPELAGFDCRTYIRYVCDSNPIFGNDHDVVQFATSYGNSILREWGLAFHKEAEFVQIIDNEKINLTTVDDFFWVNDELYGGSAGFFTFRDHEGKLHHAVTGLRFELGSDPVVLIRDVVSNGGQVVVLSDDLGKMIHPFMKG